MTFNFSVLASGSTGNTFYIGTEKERILVDAGLSGKQIDRLFDEVGLNPKDLTNILVTHEHSDHIKGLDRKSTRLNSSHVAKSYAVFCCKRKRKSEQQDTGARQRARRHDRT